MENSDKDKIKNSEKDRATASETEKEKRLIYFPYYLSRKELHLGLKSGKFIKGVIHINQKFTKQAFIDNEDNSKPDHVVTSFVDRNRALDRDEVIAKTKTILENGRKEVEVVSISKKVHSRSAIGQLKPIDKNSNFALFTPRDRKFPIIHIHKSNWPEKFEQDPDQYKNTLFVAKISKWVKIKNALGDIMETLGPSGDLKVENLAILREFGVVPLPYSATFIKFLLDQSLQTPKSDLHLREDMRRRCVFTIDNPKTKDIDDAISCQELPNGNYEIGVHIADVSHYVAENTELDKIVRERATSAYLVDKVFHMLPTELCLHCSLSPGEDKLAFSLFCEMTSDGLVKNIRAAKTVINSCAQLNYEQAQEILDKPDSLRREDLPRLFNGFTWDDLTVALNRLNKVARFLKESRKRHHGLSWNRTSASFLLDDVTGEPLQIVTKKSLPAHELIEEFMLLTNIRVAKRIHGDFPYLALLRIDEGPNPTKMFQLQQSLKAMGVDIDTSSSKELQESLDKYIDKNNVDGDAHRVVLNSLVRKCMQKGRDNYVCSGYMKKGVGLNHFGLGFPVYTHFTSPIRRYADIMTHRLLAASLSHNRPQWTPEDVSDIAQNLNRKKFQAKKAEEACFDLYLSYYVERHQPYIQDAVVVSVKEKSFDVIVFNIDRKLRIYTNTFEEGWIWKSERINEVDKKKERSDNLNVKSMWRISITFPQSETEVEKLLVVDVFTIVKVGLLKRPKVNQLKAMLHRL